MSPLGKLWSCPKCGRKLVGRNMWHACNGATVAGFLRRGDAAARALYRRFEHMIAACGPYHVSPAKTRIAFQARVRFGGVSAIRPGELVISFALPRPRSSRRFLDVKEIVPGWWAHRLRVTRLGDLDDELQGWLRESYRLMGMQERLRKGSQRKARSRRTDREARAG